MSTEDLNRNASRNRQTVQKSKSKNKIKVFGTNLFIDGGFDIIFMILVFALLTTGLIMMFSASYVTAKYSAKTDGNPFFYISRQMLFAAIGLVAMFFLSKVNPEVIKKFVPLIAGVSIALLILVLFYHTDVPDSPKIKRWMEIPGLFTFQPSDIAKLGMIITLAYTLEKYKRDLEKKWWLPLVFAGGVGFVCFLVFEESHLSGTLLMFAIGVGMLFLSGMDRRWFIFAAVLAVVVIILFWGLKDRILSPYQLERITGFSNKDYYDTDSRWQTNQSLFALGSGGFFGLGLGNSLQKFMYLPEPQNDFIFAIVGEELGFVRCVIILGLFATLVTRGFMIALKAKSAYERLLVLGICLQLGIQTVLNILVVTDMMPNTGISLPFFSYGGTAIFIQLVEMGLVLAVSRTGDRRPPKQEKDIKDRNRG